ncbi:MAG: hypothetical protein DLM60_20655 [Pseudonocardiales bacterium]|nr:MAG: hypothetical protein DLM60_20655 [Pseudonocardiales bacterium]
MVVPSGNTVGWRVGTDEFAPFFRAEIEPRHAGSVMKAVLADRSRAPTHPSCPRLPTTSSSASHASKKAPMTAQIGDEIMIISQDQLVRQGEIRGIRNDPGGVVYVVQWSETSQESLLPHGPDVVIKHRHGRGNGAVATGVAPWLSRLGHPLQWRHGRDLARHQQVTDQRLARRVEEIIGQQPRDRGLL